MKGKDVLDDVCEEVGVGVGVQIIESSNLFCVGIIIGHRQSLLCPAGIPVVPHLSRHAHPTGSHNRLSRPEILDQTCCFLS